MGEVNITPSENGPYLVSGAVHLADVDDRDVPHGEHVALCRCGRSKNMPFCDGMHVSVGFDGTLKR
jgi:CDGSH-type Zn-finger protein